MQTLDKTRNDVRSGLSFSRVEASRADTARLAELMKKHFQKVKLKPGESDLVTGLKADRDRH